MAKRNRNIIAARICGLFAIAFAPLLFIGARWYVNLMDDFPVPGPEPVRSTENSNDLLIAGVVCGLIALLGIAAVGWSMRRRQLAA